MNNPYSFSFTKITLSEVFALSLELVSTVHIYSSGNWGGIHSYVIQLIQHSVAQYTYAGVFPSEYPTLTNVSMGGVSRELAAKSSSNLTITLVSILILKHWDKMLTE